MSAVPASPATVALQMYRELSELSIAVLAVTPDPVDAGWFTVYVQGPVGNEHQETIFVFLSTFPGVTDVLVSDQTPSILRVYRVAGTSA